ncbi:MAG TPA: hypothetical protein VMZ31_11085 [Phycisphaerae bacterium]|nr:hypothetical protein [Phycisphaerae bacterium]
MSEYQYYEFQAIDRPLSEQQMAELRAISTRARITPTSFVNTYQWGNLKADPCRLLEKYFDAFLYESNWGIHWLMFRVPRDVFGAEARAYACDEALAIRDRGKHTLIQFCSEEEPSDWEEDETHLGGLIRLRSDILSGDHRALYLGWLLGVEHEDVEEHDQEPPVPPGLNDLSASLTELVEFLRIDPDLVSAAAQASQPLSGQALPPEKQLRAWIRSLSSSTKDALLLRVARGAGANLQWELLNDFMRSSDDGSGRDTTAPAPRRTVAELLAQARSLTRQRRRRLAEQRAKEKERLERQRAAARKRHIEGLVGREKQVRSDIETLIATRQPNRYDRAVELLTDLAEVAKLTKQTSRFADYTQEIRSRHGRKQNFIHRLDQAGL